MNRVHDDEAESDLDELNEEDISPPGEEMDETEGGSGEITDSDAGA